MDKAIPSSSGESIVDKVKGAVLLQYSVTHHTQWCGLLTMMILEDAAGIGRLCCTWNI